MFTCRCLITPLPHPPQTMLFRLDLEMPEDVQNELVVKMIAPVGQSGVLEICELYVASVGDNIPCLKQQAFDSVAVIG